MFVRALIAFLALAGMVAFVVPAVWLWQADGMRLVQPLGLIPFSLGVVALLWCVRDFHVSGKGTLAPWAPPEKLVVVGLYRSRSPVVLVKWLVVYRRVGTAGGELGEIDFQSDNGDGLRLSKAKSP
jgi:hypothetical protein